MDKYLRKLEHEYIKKYNIIEQQDIKDLGFKPVTLNENKYDHIDAKVSFTTQIITTHISTDIKDRKSIKRNEPKNDRYLWVELRNDYGFLGWVYALKNKEKIAERRKKDYLEKSDIILKQQKEYYQLNREKKIKNAKEYYYKNKVEIYKKEKLRKQKKL